MIQCTSKLPLVTKYSCCDFFPSQMPVVWSCSFFATLCMTGEFGSETLFKFNFLEFLRILMNCTLCVLLCTLGSVIFHRSCVSKCRIFFCTEPEVKFAHTSEKTKPDFLDNLTSLDTKSGLKREGVHGNFGQRNKLFIHLWGRAIRALFLAAPFPPPLLHWGKKFLGQNVKTEAENTDKTVKNIKTKHYFLGETIVAS